MKKKNQPTLEVWGLSLRIPNFNWRLKADSIELITMFDFHMIEIGSENRELRSNIIV